MSDQVTFYKIRHRKTDCYSKGGVYVPADGHGGLWVKKGGKTWDTLGKLRAHITSHMNKYNNTDMSDWEVIEYRCVPTDVKPVHEMVDPKKLVELLKR
jgi:hypothetical protein